MTEWTQPSRVLPFCILVLWLYWNAAGVVVLADNAEGGAGMLKTYELTLSSPTLEHTIGLDLATPSLIKFVQIEVAKVNNPQLIPLSFKVDFQPVRGEQIYLGSFSLFPPNNPGKFIVATRGLLKTGGIVIVTLTPLQQASEGPNIHVWVKPLEFIGE